jgi:hypothetical protein
MPQLLVMTPSKSIPPIRGIIGAAPVASIIFLQLTSMTSSSVCTKSVLMVITAPCLYDLDASCAKQLFQASI